MTHDELLAKIDQWAKNSLGVGDLTHQQMCYGDNCKCYEHDEQGESLVKALRAVVGLHTGTGIGNRCVSCSNGKRCETIQVIEEELK